MEADIMATFIGEILASNTSSAPITDIKIEGNKEMNIKVERDEVDESSIKQDSSLTCNLCHKKYKNKCNLKSHMVLHTGIKSFKCDVCEKSFATKSHLTRHSIIHSGEKNFDCKICGRKFYRQGHVNEHMLVHNKDKKLPCPECDKKFARKASLAIHMRLHTGEKPFVCQVCGKSFHQKCHLDAHSDSHDGSKKYVCDQCERTFARKEHLVTHMITHATEKSYPCDLCHKAFVHPIRLKKHMKLHNREKKFVCEQCGEGFGAQYQLISHHVKMHEKIKEENFADPVIDPKTGLRRYTCPRCGKDFKLKCQLQKHCEVHERKIKEREQKRAEYFKYKKEKERMESELPTNEIQQFLQTDFVENDEESMEDSGRYVESGEEDEFESQLADDPDENSDQVCSEDEATSSQEPSYHSLFTFSDELSDNDVVPLNQDLKEGLNDGDDKVTTS